LETGKNKLRKFLKEVRPTTELKKEEISGVPRYKVEKRDFKIF